MPRPLKSGGYASRKLKQNTQLLGNLVYVDIGLIRSEIDGQNTWKC